MAGPAPIQNRCYHCEAWVPLGAPHFCAGMVGSKCPGCLENITEGWKFCPNCGKEL